jgi:hypothetical protein
MRLYEFLQRLYNDLKHEQNSKKNIKAVEISTEREILELFKLYN